ncbi:MAG: translation initiation factor Sui1 [Myxococcota bacterium]|nr:translation initiation factor Sui1 [Myxococcota bacterium]
MKNDDSTLVYSSETGGNCKKCNKSMRKCRCKTAPATTHASDGIVRVGRETKGRKGKAVTVVTGLPLDAVALKALAKDLKSRCGTGGTIKGGVIEIQGEHRDLLMEELQKRGYKVRRSGG